MMYHHFLQSQQQPQLSTPVFTFNEMEKLLEVSSRFMTGERETFSEAEISQMLFVRWLIENGRLEDDKCEALGG